MSNSFIDLITGVLEGKIPAECIILIISLIPILELRGGIIAASLLNVPMTKALIFCIAGNLIPIPFILKFIMQIFEWMKKKSKFKKIVNGMEHLMVSKSQKIERGKFWGLLCFVGIPLPGTGAWTGALVAACLGLPRKKAFIAITLGVCMAATIMTLIAYGLPALWNFI